MANRPLPSRGKRVVAWSVAALCAVLALTSCGAALVLAGPVLSGDRGGDFVGGYFSGAARGLLVASVVIFLASLVGALVAAARASRRR